VAESITNETGRAEALARVVGALAARGDVTQAREVAETIAADDARSDALARMAAALAATGEVTQAREVAESIIDDDSRLAALVDVAHAHANGGDLRGAASLIGAAWLIDGHPFSGWQCLLSTDPDAALSLVHHLRGRL
jgi:hypothetical protein